MRAAVPLPGFAPFLVHPLQAATLFGRQFNGDLLVQILEYSPNPAE